VLYACIVPMGWFTFVLGVMMSAFAIPFHILFGHRIETFVTFQSTFFQLFRGLSGDLPIDDMLAFDYVSACVLYSFFIAVMLFVVMTVVIAIISDQYVLVQEMIQLEAKDGIADEVEVPNDPADERMRHEHLAYIATLTPDQQLDIIAKLLLKTSNTALVPPDANDKTVDRLGHLPHEPKMPKQPSWWC